MNYKIYTLQEGEETSSEEYQKADVVVQIIEQGDDIILKTIKNRFGNTRAIVLNDSDEKCEETNNKPKIALYAILEKGEGRVMKVGTYDSIEDIEIIIGMFSKDTVLEFQYES
jgi:hypothetical protein